MNIGIVFAGGVGSRMGKTEIPKQFLEIEDVPVIIHTLKVFENCDEIDAVSISCIEEYLDYLKELLEKFNIKKVKWLSPGGDTGQLSIFNGIKAVWDDESVPKDSLLLIHDAVRPIIDSDLLKNNIRIAKENGNSITVCKAIETTFTSNNGKSVDDVLDRDKLYFAKAPQCFFLSDIYNAHIKAIERNDVKNWDSCALMRKENVELFFCEGKSSNIKMTTMEDFNLIKTMMSIQKENN